MQEYATEFQGKRAFITGGSRGIGAATAQRLLPGATVVVAARTRHAQTPAGATFLAGDISTLAGANAVAAEALQLLTAGLGITPERLLGAIPLGRAGTAEELAETIAFLVSERAAYITGHNQFVTGGQGELA